MQTRHVPVLDRRYWVMICLASIFGANLGDFISHILGLGHVSGLFPLAIIFIAILLIERRVAATTQLFYWLAIITLRTAATNLADLANHDLKLGDGLVIASLAVLLAVLVAIAHRRGDKREQDNDLPVKTDPLYWLAMLVAGTLGTALGDGLADDLGFGAGGGAILSCAALALLLAARSRLLLRSAGFYWLTIVSVRTAGTNLGDFLVSRDGVNLGLLLGTPLTGMTLLGAMLLWREHPALSAVPGAASEAPPARP